MRRPHRLTTALPPSSSAVAGRRDVGDIGRRHRALTAEKEDRYGSTESLGLAGCLTAPGEASIRLSLRNDERDAS